MFWAGDTFERDVRKERRAEREREFGRSVPDGKYGVIIADTFNAERIQALAAKNCVLLLSAGGSLFDAINVISACGFIYKTNICQAFDQDAGADAWCIFRHHLWLVATRGIVPAPAMGTQWPSLIQSADTHIMDMFAAEFFPTAPVIDLFNTADEDENDDEGLAAE